MKTKTLKSQWDISQWITAYEEAVKRVLKWQGFTVKATSYKYFEKMVRDRPDVDPNLWMRANFPPYREWRIPNKKGQWRVIKYPYPKMLNSENSRKHYQRLKNQGVESVSSRRDTIINGVNASIKRLDQCKVELNNYQRVWDMYVIKYVSPYVLLMLPEMGKWIERQVRCGEIALEELEEVKSYKKVLNSYNNLNIELWKIIKEKI